VLIRSVIALCILMMMMTVLLVVMITISIIKINSGLCGILVTSIVVPCLTD